MTQDMDVTFDVTVWSTEVYKGKTKTSYVVRWKVAGRRWKQRCATAALADSLRSELVTATRRGEAFDVASGRPVSLVQQERATMTFYEFACAYVDTKWPVTSPHHRKGTAEALTTATMALLTQAPARETAQEIRSALLNWGYNHRRGSAEQPEAATRHLAWVAARSRPVADLARPEVLRKVLVVLETKLDGTRAAGRTATWKRSILSTSLHYAVELGLLQANPVPKLKVPRRRAVRIVDRRCVVNPSQARALLETVRVTPRSGALLVAFFGCLYYSALRPEEAVNLRLRNLELPAQGWGWLLLEKAAPEVDKQWSDTGRRRESRELKHRAVGETRRVPCPPELTRLLHEHLAEFGADEEGRLFRGERGGPLAGVTYTRLWDRARAAALTPEQYASPLAARPYDLRHAAVSTWLNSGVPATQVAEWAGHSVAILLRVYAKCLDGQEHEALRRIDEALGGQ